MQIPIDPQRNVIGAGAYFEVYAIPCHRGLNVDVHSRIGVELRSVDTAYWAYLTRDEAADLRDALTVMLARTAEIVTLVEVQP